MQVTCSAARSFLFSYLKRLCILLKGMSHKPANPGVHYLLLTLETFPAEPASLCDLHASSSTT